MSQAPDNTGHPGTRRVCNLQKFDAETGELIWSRYLLPPFWPVARVNSNGYIGGAGGSSAFNVQPIHGTNDVIVRLKRTNGSSPPCLHVLARVNKFGSVEWWAHHHLDGSHIPLNDIAAQSDGTTFIASTSTSGTTTANRTLTINSSGNFASVAATSATPQSSIGLLDIPGVAGVLARHTEGNEATPTNVFATYLTRTDGGTRSFGSGRNTVRPLGCSDSLIVCGEEWNRGLNGTGDDPTNTNGPKTEGIVLRTIGGSYSLDPPPQSDVVASVQERSCFVDDVYWRARFGAIYGDNVYCLADRVSVDAWNGGSAPTETEIPRLVCFDTSLAELWYVSAESPWGILADPEGCIVGRENIIATAPFQRTNMIERYGSNGILKWRQAIYSSIQPSQMCLSDDGYLYLVGGHGTLAN